MRNNYLVRNRILGLIIVMVSILILFIIWSIRKDYYSTIEHAQHQIKSSSTTAAEHAVRSIGEGHLILNAIIAEFEDYGGWQKMSEQQLHRLFNSHLQSRPQIGSIFLVDKRANIVCNSIEYPHRNLNIADREYYLYHTENPSADIHIANAYKNRIDGKWRFSLSKRLNNPDGSFAGTIGIAFLSSYFESLYDKLREIPSEQLAILRSDGKYLAVSPSDEKLFNLNMRDTDLFKKHLPQKEEGLFINLSGDNKSERIIAYKKLPAPLNLVAVSSCEKDEVLEHWRKSSYIFLLIGTLSTVAIITLGSLLIRRLELIAEADTEVRRVTRELEEERYQTILLTSVDGFWMVAVSDGRILHVNEAYSRMSGYSPEELLNMRVSDIEIIESEEDIRARISKVISEGCDRFEGRHRRKDGSELIVEVSASYLPKDRRCIAFIRDITTIKKLQQELLFNARLFAQFMKYSPVYTFIKEVNGANSRVLQVSDNFVKMTGIPSAEMIGKTMQQLFPMEFADKMTADDLMVVLEKKSLQKDETFNGRNYITYKFPIECDENRAIIAGYTIDITDLKAAESERINLERQLLQAQKMESLGVLAGGIAHDFNNILTAIIGNSELAMMRIDKDSPAGDNLRNIEQSALRAADLARQMLAYSGKGKYHIEQVDLNRLIEDMMSLLEVSVFKKCLLRLDLQPYLPCVEADATQLRQIIMNLVINASEAINNESGVISIKTSLQECDLNYLKSFKLAEDLDAGQYLCLEITDTGCGMDRPTVERIFDPFFTTKFTGRGLGMAAVQGIIRSHKGGVMVQSEPGKGSSFKIIFPAGNIMVTTANTATVTDSWHGSGTVLLVDDEEIIREIGAELLKELGFTVVTAIDGFDAIQKFKATADISFVLLDLTMPNMDGEECSRELTKINPEISIIISSGYSEEEVSQRFKDHDIVGFIQKPYKLSDLKDAIRKFS
ncbi:MAG: PAS domain S-box protein [Geobacteraceae bacterium]|nr:PAS domain S-box protein [Geobacteraceae bacterium]